VRNQSSEFKDSINITTDLFSDKCTWKVDFYLHFISNFCHRSWTLDPSWNGHAVQTLQLPNLKKFNETLFFNSVSLKFFGTFPSLLIPQLDDSQSVHFNETQRETGW